MLALSYATSPATRTEVDRVPEAIVGAIRGTLSPTESDPPWPEAGEGLDSGERIRPVSLMLLYVKCRVQPQAGRVGLDKAEADSP